MLIREANCNCAAAGRTKNWKTEKRVLERKSFFASYLKRESVALVDAAETWRVLKTRGRQWMKSILIKEMIMKISLSHEEDSTPCSVRQEDNDGNKNANQNIHHSAVLRTYLDILRSLHIFRNVVAADIQPSSAWLLEWRLMRSQRQNAGLTTTTIHEQIVSCSSHWWWCWWWE